MNILTPFEYFAPETLDEALELLATKGKCQGTRRRHRLNDSAQGKMIHPANVIDVTHIPELQEFKVEDGGVLFSALLPRMLSLNSLKK